MIKGKAVSIFDTLRMKVRTKFQVGSFTRS